MREYVAVGCVAVDVLLVLEFVLREDVALDEEDVDGVDEELLLIADEIGTVVARVLVEVLSADVVEVVRMLDVVVDVRLVDVKVITRNDGGLAADSRGRTRRHKVRSEIIFGCKKK